MSRRLVVITEIIAPYRIPVFNALARESDVDLHVIFLSETDPTLRQWAVYKDEIQFSYEVLGWWRRRIGHHHVLVNRGLGRALGNCDPDIVVCGGYNYLASWQALAWAKWRGLPFVVWIESTNREQRRRLLPVELTKRMFMRACDGFVVPGKASAEYVMSFGASAEQVFVAPNATDTRLFDEGAARARGNAAAIRKSRGLPSRYFLFVGRLVPWKGIFDLLQAYQQLPAELRRDIGLVYAGEGSARVELSRFAAQITPGTVRVTGFLQRDELPEVYGLAEALVFPTHSDAWGLVVNEAMACGLPVITTDVAGCREDLMQDGQNGFVVPAANVARLAESMKVIAGNAQRREEMGRRSTEIIARHTPEKCAAGFAALRFAEAQGAARWKPIS